MKALYLLILIAMLASCKDSETRFDKTIAVKQNEMVILKMYANHSTSYKWHLTNKPDIVDSVDYDYKVHSSNDGAGGMEYWKFKGIKKGKDSLRFVYIGHDGREADRRSYWVEVQ